MDYLNLPLLVFIVIFQILVLTITRSFKLFATGFCAALFPRKEISGETREQAAKLFRLLSKITIIAAVITTVVSFISMLMAVDFSSESILWTLGGNSAAALLSLFYGFIIAFIFEPIAYILGRR